jgi:hypothetical protein
VISRFENCVDLLKKLSYKISYQQYQHNTDDCLILCVFKVCVDMKINFDQAYDYNDSGCSSSNIWYVKFPVLIMLTTRMS